MKFPLIQIYRALAAILVVLFHMGSNTIQYYNTPFFDNIFRFGNIGVDFFFVLSGFIITYIHYKDISKKVNFSVYIKKRIIRVYPIYWVLATISLLSYIVLTKGYINSMDKTIHLNSSEDILYIVRCYFLIPGKEQFFIKVAWTLSFEILFYLVFSLCILLGLKVARRIYFIWVILILSNNFIFHFSGVIGFFTSFFILEFLMGCFVAYFVLKGKEIASSFLVILTLISILSLIFFFEFFEELFLQKPFLVYLLLAISASLIILLCTKIKKIINPNWATKIGILIGDASYSIYLSHIFYLSIFGRLLGKRILQLNLDEFQLSSFTIVIFISVILGGVGLHLIIEKPLIRLLNTYFIGHNSLKSKNFFNKIPLN